MAAYDARRPLFRLWRRTGARPRRWRNVFSGTKDECRAEWHRLIDAGSGDLGDFYIGPDGVDPSRPIIRRRTP